MDAFTVAPEARLHIRLFGYPFMEWADGAPMTLESNKVRALFVYLLLHVNAAQPRDYLSYLLWPDVTGTRARKNLRQALYNLRNALGPLAETCLDIQRESVTLRGHPALWVDAWAFQEKAEAVQRHRHRAYGACPYCARQYEHMAQLYRGDFMAGFHLKESPPMAEWLREQGWYYRQRMQDGVHLLLRYHYLRGDYEQVVRVARWWLQKEPWDESCHAYLMRALAHQGRSGEALRVYGEFVRRLEADMHTSPPPEAEHLAYEIQEGLLPEPESVHRARRLPAPLTPLVGRQSEFEYLLSRLAQPETRLVTLTGPGGSGKTRLAQELARALVPLFPEGIYWISLEDVASEDGFRRALQEALEEEFAPQTWREQWHQWARDRRALLVLDNADDLVDDLGHWLPPLLLQAREITLLVTSRQALDLRQEQRFPLQGLSFPEAEEDVATLEQALAYPAVVLFVERARAIRPDFHPKSEELQALLDILRFVQGLPLAVELAASQAARTSCKEVLAHLRQACLDLTSPYRDQPQAHRSLRALFQTSWENLPEGHRTALLRLAVFQGPFDAELARTVARVSRPSLEALYRVSMLESEEHPLWGRRWFFHPLVREFAREYLARDPHLYQDVQEQARAWVGQRLVELGHLDGPEKTRLLQHLSTLQDEVNAFLMHLTREGDLETIHACLMGIAAWFAHMGLYREGWQYFTMLESRVLTLMEEGGDLGRRTLARLYHRKARMAFRLNDLEGLQREIERSLHLLHLEPDDPPLLDYGWALQLHAAVFQFQGRLDEAERVEKEALAVFQAHGQAIDQANALNNLGGIAFHRGDMDKAAQYFRGALEKYREAGALVFMANTLSNLSMVELTRNRPEEARRVCEEALRTAQQVHALLPLTLAWTNLGTIATTTGEYALGYRYLRRAEHLARRVGNMDLLCNVLSNQGVALHHLKRYQEAQARFEESLQVAREHNLLYNLSSALHLYAQMSLEMQDLPRTKALLTQALEVVLEHGFTYLLWSILHTAARYLHARGRTQEARALVLWLDEQELTSDLRASVRETMQQWSCTREKSRIPKHLPSTPERWLHLLRSLR